MKALNRIAAYRHGSQMVYIYLENAHNISIYHPIMTFNGGCLDELRQALRDHLGLPEKLQLEVYNRRMGGSGRKRLSTLPQDLTDVYVLLKVESADVDNK